MENQNWQDDPALKGMDLKKLAFLSQLVSQSGSQSKDNIIPFLMAATRNAGDMGINFSDSETDLILNVLKDRMNPEEQQRIETFRTMAQTLSKMQNKPKS